MVKKVTLPKLGLTLSQIGLGLSRIHKLASTKDQRRLLDCAIDLDITHFDTARVYGDGIAEKAIGRLPSHQKNKITIATKFGMLPNKWIGSMGAFGAPLRLARTALRKLTPNNGPLISYTVDTLNKHVEDSLRALKTECIDILFIHDPAPEAQISMNVFEEATRLKNKGYIKNFGVAGSNIQTLLSNFKNYIDVIQTDENVWKPEIFIPDITYSVFANPNHSKKELLKTALARRPNSSIIIGTNNTEHLRQLVNWAAE